jgi:hypothetical protein
MDFFNNLTAAQAAAIGRPTFGTAVVNEGINVLMPPPRPVEDIKKPPVEIGPPIEIEDTYDDKKQIEGDPAVGYFGGGGGYSEETAEVIPTETKKSNLFKTLLVLTGVGLGLWLLAGGKKIKAK